MMYILKQHEWTVGKFSSCVNSMLTNTIHKLWCIFYNKINRQWENFPPVWTLWWPIICFSYNVIFYDKLNRQWENFSRQWENFPPMWAHQVESLHIFVQHHSSVTNVHCPHQYHILLLWYEASLPGKSMVYMQRPITLWLGEWNSQPLDQESNALSKRPLSVGFNCKISRKTHFSVIFLNKSITQLMLLCLQIFKYKRIAQLEGLNSGSLGHTHDCPHQIRANYLRIMLTSKEVFSYLPHIKF